MSDTSFQRRDAGPRLLASAHGRNTPATLEEHVACYGRLPDLDPRVILAAVDDSGLLGRGGGGFPTGAKLAAVRAQKGRRVVVANGVEGEPLSLKDKALLRNAPHLVLDGIELAAAAVGAREAILAIAESARAELAAVELALRERQRVGLDRVGVVVAPAPERFIVGEETALVAWLSGKPAKPTLTPPRPSERGVRGRPTLVQNVETLAHIALIARFGPGWFRTVGSPAEPGSALITLSGAVQRPGVVEIVLGASIRDVVEGRGGATEPIGAFLVGGYFGYLGTGRRRVRRGSARCESRQPRGPAGGARDRGAAGASLRHRGERPGGPLARRRERRPVRIVLPRSRCSRGRVRPLGARRRPRPSPLAEMARRDRGPWSLPASRRSSRLPGERARRIRPRGRAPCGRPVHRRWPLRPAHEPGGMKHVLQIDPIACDGRGLCAELLPELVRLDDWGYPIIASGAVPPELTAHARRAVDACPMLALSLAQVGASRPSAPSRRGSA